MLSRKHKGRVSGGSHASKKDIDRSNAWLLYVYTGPAWELEVKFGTMQCGDTL